MPRPSLRVRLLMLGLALSACNRLAPSRVDLPADSAAGEIDFELAGPGGAALVVPVRINGRGPFDFILDTGATITCVDEQVARALDLPDLPGAFGMGAGVASQGALRLVTMDSLHIGPAAAIDLRACVVDLQHLEGLDLDIDGLLGLNFLKEFLVTLDFERSVVRLGRPGAADPER